MPKTLRSEKRYSKDINTLTEDRKILLDNLRKKVYNIRRGSMKEYKNMKLLEDKFSLSRDTEVSQRCLTVLTEALKMVNDITTNEFGLTTVIAGGAVRDVVLGHSYRDIDFFVSDVPEEMSLDDTVVHTTALLRDKHRGYLGLPPDTKAREIDSPRYTMYLSSDVGQEFRGYRYPYTTFGSLDFLARHSTLSETIDGFDHDLARAYMSADGEIYISEGFEAVLRAGRIQPDSQRTRDRLQNWKRRTRDPIVIGKLKVEMPSKSKMKVYNYGTMTTYTTTSATGRDIFARDIEILGGARRRPIEIIQFVDNPEQDIPAEVAAELADAIDEGLLREIRDIAQD